ncbi:sterol desaturase family protein [uncultured Ferrimonas sp.]|uniref:sterol desaturase family protein n=1 Tax=uncultured Ferrimonas sp. TaxID=432640 RepID=UPI00260B7CBE|nr:sterol desaturase family protein [uncultured Ferrimonas sp.]
MGEYNYSALAIPLFLLLMALEWWAARQKQRPLHRLNDSVASLSMGSLLLVSDALLKGLTFAAFIYLFEQHRLFDFSIDSPFTWLLFFLGVDLCYYGFHRCAHAINLLWGAHVGHHQSEEFNLTTALRQSAFQYAFSWVFYLPLALLGCPPLLFLLQFVLLKAYQFWLHTQLIQRIPLLEGIFSTPSSHRVHHAKNPLYVDRNYGGTLVIWDRLFGSWQPELATEPCHYGTTKPLDTFNPIKANLQHWQMLAQDSINTRRNWDKVRLWWMPTGWRPADCLAADEHAVAQQHDGCGNRAKFDPATSQGARFYAAVSMLALMQLLLPLVWLAPQLSVGTAMVGLILVLGSVVVINVLFEGRRIWAWLEPARWLALLWFSAELWLRIG